MYANEFEENKKSKLYFVTNKARLQHVFLANSLHIDVLKNDIQE